MLDPRKAPTSCHPRPRAGGPRRACRGSGRARQRRNRACARARSRPRRSRSLGRGRCRRRPRRCARRGTLATADPGRARASARSGRRSARAERRAHARAPPAPSRSRPRHESKLSPVALRDDLERIARAAAKLAGADEELAGVVPAEPAPGRRTYLCAYIRGEERTWLVLDDDGASVTDRALVRRTASIVGMSELAEESAGGGELEELRERLVALRLTESPAGVEEAEEAALELQQGLGAPPRVAETGYLDRGGAATRQSPRLQKP